MGLKGAFRLDGDLLTISGRQLNDTLELKYKRRDIKPKEWFGKGVGSLYELRQGALSKFRIASRGGQVSDEKFSHYI